MNKSLLSLATALALASPARAFAYKLPDAAPPVAGDSTLSTLQAISRGVEYEEPDLRVQRGPDLTPGILETDDTPEMGEPVSGDVVREDRRVRHAHTLAVRADEDRAGSGAQSRAVPGYE